MVDAVRGEALRLAPGGKSAIVTPRFRRAASQGPTALSYKDLKRAPPVTDPITPGLPAPPAAPPPSATPPPPTLLPVGAPIDFPLSWLLDHSSAPIQYRATIDVARIPLSEAPRLGT